MSFFSGAKALFWVFQSPPNEKSMFLNGPKVKAVLCESWLKPQVPR